MLYFAHKDDTNFGVSKFARGVIVGGMFMWVLPILWIPVDVLLSLNSDTARSINFWLIMIQEGLQMSYIWLVCPIILAFYETEATDTKCSRIW